jgi:hypothetical protein
MQSDNGGIFHRQELKSTGRQSMSSSMNEKPQGIILDIIIGLLVFVLPVLGGFILQSISPDLNRELGSVIFAIGIILGLVFLILFIKASGILRRVILVLMVFLLALVACITYIVFSGPPRRGTVYLIVDASENMRGRFQRLGSRISLTAARAPENIDVGIMLVGGGISGATGCDDISPLVKPAARQTSLPEIEKRTQLLNDLDPQGVGTLQRALMKAIKEELVGRPAVQQIIVFTSGADIRCGRLDRPLLDLAADQSKVQFILSIISVGPQSKSDEAILQGLADRGKYSNIDNASEIPTIVPPKIYPPYYPYGAPYKAP